RIQYKQLAVLYLSHMSLDEELGQLIMVQYYTANYGPDLEASIKDLYAGGVILYQWQMQALKQTRNDITQMQQHARIPLLISTDEEGGYVDRIGNIYPFRPSATELYLKGDVAQTKREGIRTARDLQALGINADMAPDVDVELRYGPLVTRTFGKTPQDVIKYAGAYMEGMQSQGMIACIKHFPGLGDTDKDAHTALPIIKRSKEQIYSVELAPFKHFIQTQNALQRPGMIMSTDLLMPAIDPVWPAEISHTFITDILRKELGYDGVVSTDALYMEGIAQKWSLPQAAVLALKAGNDMIIGPNGSGQMAAVLNAIKAALKDGTLSRARVDEAATRILALKMQYHLMPTLPPVA
ncbi:MAG: glycoside hydrolase family 3, partial [Ktedonobacteraceae bacterium]|nr:glycoside hydrolase family 3 [Ktedonobacteraceae bacterium]